MPYPTEHACRLLDPGQFVRFRRDNSKDPNIIIGFRGDGSSAAQAYRYPKNKWTVDRARNHCKKHDGSFEAASEEDSQTPEIEKRFLAQATAELAVEERAEGKLPKLVGYAALFGVKTELSPGYLEKIAQGAFTRTLMGTPDVRALVDHDPSKILARTKSNTLRLWENTKGLKVEIKPANTQIGRDIVASIERGDVDQMSFAFRPVKDEIERHKDGSLTRTLLDVDLFDVSPVTFPAYPQTTIVTRALEHFDIGPVHEYRPCGMDNRTQELIAAVEAEARKVGYTRECGG